MQGIDPTALLMIPIFLFALSVHEFAHAYSAKLAGDMTAAAQGRLTINPIAHIDPIGTVLVPIILLISNFPVIGWARPVPVNPMNFRKLTWDVYVSLAGPFSNFALAILAAIAGWFMLATGLVGSNEFMYFPRTNSIIVLMIEYFMLINILLGFFNLIPIPPLDGSHLLTYFLTHGYRQSSAGLQFLERYGFILLIIIIWTPLGNIFFRTVMLVFLGVNRVFNLM